MRIELYFNKNLNKAPGKSRDSVLLEKEHNQEQWEVAPGANTYVQGCDFIDDHSNCTLFFERLKSGLADKIKNILLNMQGQAQEQDFDGWRKYFKYSIPPTKYTDQNLYQKHSEPEKYILHFLIQKNDKLETFIGVDDFFSDGSLIKINLSYEMNLKEYGIKKELFQIRSLIDTPYKWLQGKGHEPGKYCLAAAIKKCARSDYTFNYLLHHLPNDFKFLTTFNDSVSHEFMLNWFDLQVDNLLKIFNNK